MQLEPTGSKNKGKQVYIPKIKVSKYTRIQRYKNTCIRTYNTYHQNLTNNGIQNVNVVHVCMYVVCTFMYVCMYICTCMYVCMYNNVYVCMYAYVCMYMYVHVCTLYVCTYVYVCMHVHNVRMYIHVRKNLNYNAKSVQNNKLFCSHPKPHNHIIYTTTYYYDGAQRHTKTTAANFFQPSLQRKLPRWLALYMYIK